MENRENEFNQQISRIYADHKKIRDDLFDKLTRFQGEQARAVSQYLQKNTLVLDGLLVELKSRADDYKTVITDYAIGMEDGLIASFDKINESLASLNNEKKSLLAMVDHVIVNAEESLSHTESAIESNITSGKLKDDAVNLNNLAIDLNNQFLEYCQYLFNVLNQQLPMLFQEMFSMVTDQTTAIINDSNARIAELKNEKSTIQEKFNEIHANEEKSARKLENLTESIKNLGETNQIINESLQQQTNKISAVGAELENLDTMVRELSGELLSTDYVEAMKALKEGLGKFSLYKKAKSIQYDEIAEKNFDEEYTSVLKSYIKVEEMHKTLSSSMPKIQDKISQIKSLNNTVNLGNEAVLSNVHTMTKGFSDYEIKLNKYKKFITRLRTLYEASMQNHITQLNARIADKEIHSNQLNQLNKELKDLLEEKSKNLSKQTEVLSNEIEKFKISNSILSEKNIILETKKNELVKNNKCLLEKNHSLSVELSTQTKELHKMKLNYDSQAAKHESTLNEQKEKILNLNLKLLYQAERSISSSFDDIANLIFKKKARLIQDKSNFEMDFIRLETELKNINSDVKNSDNVVDNIRNSILVFLILKII